MVCLITRKSGVATIELCIKNLMDNNKIYRTDQGLTVGKAGHVYQNCL